MSKVMIVSRNHLVDMPNRPTDEPVNHKGTPQKRKHLRSCDGSGGRLVFTLLLDSQLGLGRLVGRQSGVDRRVAGQDALRSMRAQTCAPCALKTRTTSA